MMDVKSEGCRAVKNFKEDFILNLDIVAWWEGNRIYN
jgi:hypothetical protein